MYTNKECLKAISKLPARIYTFLYGVGTLCDNLDYEAYLVGGFVRDIILDIDNTDIDIVIVGDAIQVAKIIGNEYNAQIKIHKQFQTSSLAFDDGIKADFITARREEYKHSGSLPDVFASSIDDDLYRRDFTINSMAICLNKIQFGELIDPYGGQKDLQQGLIRVLYNMSFIDDPTRIFRAVRFEQRLGLQIEEHTLQYIKAAVGRDVLNNVSRERLTNEILLVLKEDKVSKILNRLLQLGIFNKLYVKLNIDEKIINLIDGVKSGHLSINKELVYFLILFSNLECIYLDEELKELALNKIYKKSISYFVSNKDNIISILNSDTLSNYEVYSALKSCNKEELVVLKNISNELAAENISKFQNIKNTKIEIDGSTLKDIGINPGPKIKVVLEKVFEAKVNGIIKTVDDEIRFAKELLKGGK